jgi:L-iditol 2-dehydrogenase
MKNMAAVLTALNTLEMKEISMPTPKAGEVMVKLQAVGVCGSDVHYYQHGRIGDFIVKFPFILGHECAGIVTEVGEGVTHLKAGDHVCLEPGVPCGKCEFCLSGHYNLCPDVQFLATPPYDGCLMNYIAYPAEWAFKIPDHMSYEEGALVEPLAIGINAAKTGGVSLGQSVLIYGAGCIGLMSLLAAKAYGATTIFVADVLDKRLQTAQKLGAIPLNSTKVNVTEEIMKATGSKGVDAVLDCAGVSATVTGSIKTCKAGGSIVVVGMAADTLDGIPLGPVSTKELKITSIFRYKNLYPTTIAAIAGGKIDVKEIVSNRYRFEETPRAFEETVKNIKNVVKSVIVFD